MDILDKRIIDYTIETLKKNKMDGFYCETSEKAVELVESLIEEGSTIACGGSVSLKESKILDLIKSDKYNFLDRDEPGLTRDEVNDLHRQTLKEADFYFASSNAVTEDGILYNVDGNSNRVSAIAFGPKNVILVCGYNKIVKDLNSAIKRVKTIAAPKNTKRLNSNTYCAKTGKCVSLKNKESLMSDGCSSDDRICCNYLVSAQQRHQSRIKVIIVGEELGY